MTDCPAVQVGDGRAHGEHISRPPAEDQKSPPRLRIAQAPRANAVCAGHGPAININTGQAVPSQGRAPVAQRIEQGTSNPLPARRHYRTDPATGWGASAPCS